MIYASSDEMTVADNVEICKTEDENKKNTDE